MTGETLRIPRRFCGPPDSGNGGYVCGRLAAYHEGPVAVRLRIPPPLEVDLEVRRTQAGVAVAHEGRVVAEARPARVELEVPEPPTVAEAEAASRSFRGFESHAFPTCFVCGPRRGEGDGLRIFPGPVPGRDLVACTWVPDASLGTARGEVAAEFLWAALDCPGGFAFAERARGAVLLGELAASFQAAIAVGERCVLVGWELSREGRKHHTGTALFSEAGRCRGAARATWFEVSDFPGGGAV